MSPMDSESLQTEARKPVALVESDTTASASPGHSPGLGAHSSQSEVLRQLKLAGSSNDSGDSPRHPKVCHRPHITGVSRSDMITLFAVRGACSTAI